MPAKVTKKTVKKVAKSKKYRCPHCKKVIPFEKLEKVEDTKSASGIANFRYS